MQKTLKNSFVLLFAVATAALAIVAYQAIISSTASAHEGETAQAQEQKPEGGDQQPVPEYTYTAQPGDSYTQLARKAVQTYGINNNVNLSQAAIVFAETSLTQEVKGEVLAEGQQITVDAALVKKWVEAATKLSEAEQKAWAVYVPFVNFNTDKVGQSS